jgi:hypothetical protein
MWNINSTILALNSSQIGHFQVRRDLATSLKTYENKVLAVSGDKIHKGK